MTVVKALFTRYSRFGRNSGLGCASTVRHFIRVALLQAVTVTSGTVTSCYSYKWHCYKLLLLQVARLQAVTVTSGTVTSCYCYKWHCYKLLLLQVALLQAVTVTSGTVTNCYLSQTQNCVSLSGL
jgi:hypothetical protein